MSAHFAYFRSDKIPSDMPLDIILNALHLGGWEASYLATHLDIGFDMIRVELSPNEEDRDKQRGGLEYFLRGALPEVNEFAVVNDDGEQRRYIIGEQNDE